MLLRSLPASAALGAATLLIADCQRPAERSIADSAAAPDAMVPVTPGSFYTCWFEAPSSVPLGKSARNIYVCVREVKGAWARVDLYPSQVNAVQALWLERIGQNDPAARAMLVKAGKTEEEALAEMEKASPSSKRKREMWLNLATVEAIDPLSLPTPEETAGSAPEIEH